MTGPGPTPDFPDWAQPTANVDLAQKSTDLSATIGRTDPALSGDVSRWAAMFVTMDPPQLVAGARYEILVTWFQDALAAWTDTVTYWDTTDAKLSLAEFIVAFPVRGTSVQLAIKGENANKTQLSTILDSRPLPGLSVRRHTITQPNRLVSQLPATAVGAGATNTIHAHPSTDLVRLYVPPCDTHLIYTLSAVQDEIAGFATVDLAQLVGNAAIGQVLDVNAPGLGLQVAVNNTDVAGHNAAWNLWDLAP